MTGKTKQQPEKREGTLRAPEAAAATADDERLQRAKSSITAMRDPSPLCGIAANAIGSMLSAVSWFARARPSVWRSSLVVCTARNSGQT